MKKLFVSLLAIMLIFTACSKRSTPENEINEEISENENSGSEENEQENEVSEQEDLTKTLIIPEGYTLARIGMLLEEMEVCSVSEFILASQMGDFSEFSLIAQQEENPNRGFKLEGYLFPDTYEIYSTESPDSIIRRLLKNTESKISSEMREQIEQSGYTVDQILTLASIIEKEAYERNDNPVPEEMPKISSVLYNRLNSGNKLECNVTATYVRGVLDEFIEGGKEIYTDYYNTYHCPALPAGAICNPGMDAINAAIYPADTNYMFFLTDEDKNFYYSETYEEHLILVDKYLGAEG